ncbi:MAG: hypothetical protein M1839_008490 [Geoglossum umbratile]|nr:MAG: hypothetical protein M1839_008490 [Geoglossum umbratile]
MFRPAFIRPLVQACSKSTTAAARNELSKRIYKPFAELVPGSPEYIALGHSGRVWEDFHKPFDIEPYLEVQSKVKEQLDTIDAWKAFLVQHRLKEKLTKALTNEYAHQSTAIEGNPLSIGDSVIIEDNLVKDFFQSLESGCCTSLNLNELAKISFPHPQSLLPGKDHYQIAEMRNHLIALKSIIDTAFTKPGTARLTLEEIHALSKILLIDTESVELYRLGWGRKTVIGEFRNTPVSVRNNPLRIFPYHVEVPSLMRRFIEWRDRTHASKVLHPIIFATHIFVAFCHIHPFADGNGRVGRTLLADYLVRQGLLPVVFRDLDRMDYLDMVSDVQDRKPEELCLTIITTQLDMLFSICLGEKYEES